MQIMVAAHIYIYSETNVVKNEKPHLTLTDFTTTSLI